MHFVKLLFNIHYSLMTVLEVLRLLADCEVLGRRALPLERIARGDKFVRRWRFRALLLARLRARGNHGP